MVAQSRMAELTEVRADRQQRRSPSIIAVWNWLGIVAHGGWFAILPFIGHIPADIRTIVLSVLAVPLLGGHLFLRHVRIVKRNRDPG